MIFHCLCLLMEFHESPKLTGMAEIAEIGMKTTVAACNAGEGDRR